MFLWVSVSYPSSLLPNLKLQRNLFECPFFSWPNHMFNTKWEIEEMLWSTLLDHWLLNKMQIFLVPLHEVAAWMWILGGSTKGEWLLGFKLLSPWSKVLEFPWYLSGKTQNSEIGTDSFPSYQKKALKEVVFRIRFLCHLSTLLKGHSEQSWWEWGKYLGKIHVRLTEVTVQVGEGASH